MSNIIQKPMLGELPNWAAPGRTGLVGEWWMIDRVGGRAGDASGQRNDGTLDNPATMWGPGYVTTDDTNNYDLEIPASSSLSFGTGPFTAIAKIRTTDAGTSLGIMGYVSGSDGWVLQAHGGKPAIWVSGTGLVGNAVINHGTWVTVGMVRVGNGSEDVLIYVDGKLDSIKTHANYNDDVVVSQLNIGSWGNDANILDGDIECAVAWNRALTPAAIAEMHVNPKRFLGYEEEKPYLWLISAAPGGGHGQIPGVGSHVGIGIGGRIGR